MTDSEDQDPATLGDIDAPSCGKGTEADATAETIFASPPATADLQSSGNELHTFTNTKDQVKAKLAPGRYRMMQSLGSGAMGTVKLADDLLIERQVAVKTLKPSGASSIGGRFLHEVRMQGQLQHPNIVTIYDAGLDEKESYAIVMEYIRGENLATIIDRLRDNRVVEQKRFPLEARVDIFVAVLNALSYAHNQGLLHCDVKPANVIIGEHGEVWLADWGIARPKTALQKKAATADSDSARKNAAETLRESNGNKEPTKPAIFGTPRYMSPEQASGNLAEIDEKSDIYSAFILLFEFLTLNEWISSQLTLQDTLAAARTKSVPQIADAVFDQQAKSVPTEMRYFLQTGLAHDRSERFTSCEHALCELNRIRAGRFAVRCPITFVKRIQNLLADAIDRWPQRVIFALLLSVIIWGLGLAGGILYALG
ncbi:MAG: serine/threonine protein kinase [Planctomycetaceae bacterium]|nr:serine/threonine protein kinase [Planctomycetaceae bacterium]